MLPRLVTHPTESYGLRITDPSGATLVYSGDTGVCDSLVELASGADVFLCEASWTHAPERPPHLHLSGTEAGRMAKLAGVGELLLTHIPPWTSREDVISENQGRVRRSGARRGLRREHRRPARLRASP